MSSNLRQIIEQVECIYAPLGKAFVKQTEKQVGALKCLNSSIKKDELKKN